MQVVRNASSLENTIITGLLNQPLRTDESFRNREQPQHHEGISPLERLGTGLVSQFRLDAMHLLYKIGRAHV